MTILIKVVASREDLSTEGVFSSEVRIKGIEEGVGTGEH